MELKPEIALAFRTIQHVAVMTTLIPFYFIICIHLYLSTEFQIKVTNLFSTVIVSSEFGG